MQEVLFASTNKAKLSQFQFVADFYKFPFRIVSAYGNHPGLAPYSEDYQTQERIVEEGARAIYGNIHTPAVVEDSILAVDVLDGLPGLRSNEYLKKEGRAGLLKALENKKERTARIISIVGYYGGKVFISFKNVVEGTITLEERFKKGEPDWVGPTDNIFGGGFNAVFVPRDSSKTIAEMTAEEGLMAGYREPNFRAVLQYLMGAIKQ